MIQFQGELVIWPKTQKNNLQERFKVILALVNNSMKQQMPLA